MNKFEECKVALRSELTKALLSHRGIRAWHYGLNLSNNDHSSSLSTYLRLTNEEYEDVLIICGLATKRKYKESTRMEMEFGPWKEFLIEISLDDNYFDKFQVNSMERKKVTWLQLGDMNRTEGTTDRVDEMNQHKHTLVTNRSAFTPGTQFKHYEAGAPRCSKRSLFIVIIVLCIVT